MENRLKFRTDLSNVIPPTYCRQHFDFSGNQQFGYVYLHPSKSNDVKFIHPSVKQVLGFNIKHRILLWPDDGKTTNFRLATPDYSKGQHTNYGHSEYQLLTDNKLGQMVTDFKKYYGCPEYVILYSSNLPCVSPPNPDNNKPRCAQMVVNAREEVENICEDAWFYLYTTHETPSSLSDPNLLPQFKERIKEKMAFLRRNRINWIHP